MPKIAGISDSYGRLVDKANRTAGHLEPWPDYFAAKANELSTIGRFGSWKRNNSSILEIGCGNGFTSALLSEDADMVVALDLPGKDPESHSIGIAAAGELIKKLSIINMTAIAASAEELPFRDKSFDVVFSEYAIQYISDKDRTLSDIYRVLKDDGVVIAVVPNFMERVFTPFMKYKYALKRALSFIINRPSDTAADRCASYKKEKRGAGNGREKLKSLEDMILLRPDGAYSSFGQEMVRHMPHSWIRLFRRNNYEIAGVFSTQILPLSVFDPLGGTAVRFLSRRSLGLNNFLCALPIMKYLGYSIGFILKKRGAG
jgi:ubiquinone/menaquinone biosynthesis C-methylase UbiE